MTFVTTVVNAAVLSAVTFYFRFTFTCTCTCTFIFTVAVTFTVTVTSLLLLPLPLLPITKQTAHTSCTSSQRHQLLGRSRMNRNRVVKIFLARAEFDGDGEALHHFIRAFADDVATDDAFLFSGGD